MCSAPRDVAQIRLDNAMRLFDEFVAATIKHPDAAALRGLERRFAERLQIQPSYWSQIKSRSRQIGERLARQFEQLSHKPNGWMDQEHGALDTAAAGPSGISQSNGALSSAHRPAAADNSPSLPQDDDERFIVGLVLTYYRRHPQRARTRLLDLLGEVLTPPAPNALPAPAPRAAAPATSDVDDWRKLQQSIAPLKPKKR
ncbi:hypothetical protein SAMN05428960_0012 [Mitsuaria sp. PDC51]|uniref:hypothetical protein n=1 Tax=Mitsuaria sp. PDC51 TaxID=1881035 RepID=UPI0008E719F2|nr:hypothetical protein [Mitsuaria sp. PDC51]SFR69823.1 hypothetical protein SAMN05428960_0012 [Mitsuaria sp. PDC51]